MLINNYIDRLENKTYHISKKSGECYMLIYNWGNIDYKLYDGQIIPYISSE